MLLFQFVVTSQLLDGLLAFGGQICISQCLGSSIWIQIWILGQFIYMCCETSELQVVHTHGFHVAWKGLILQNLQLECKVNNFLVCLVWLPHFYVHATHTHIPIHMMWQKLFVTVLLFKELILKDGNICGKNFALYSSGMGCHLLLLYCVLLIRPRCLFQWIFHPFWVTYISIFSFCSSLHDLNSWQEIFQ
jgi:hypothetical protein